MIRGPGETPALARIIAFWKGLHNQLLDRTSDRRAISAGEAMTRRSSQYNSSLVMLAVAAVFVVIAFTGRWYYLTRSADAAARTGAATVAAAAATALTVPIADAMAAPMHDRLAEITAEQRRRAMLATRVVGVMLGEGVAHLIVDRDPGPLPEARDHLCTLAALASPQGVAGRSLTVSVGRPGRPSAIVGAIDC